MHWFYLLGSIACLGLAMMHRMPTFGVLVFLIGALVLLVAWMLGLMSSRISSQSRDVSHVMGPEELRLLREQAQARKAKPTDADASDGDA